MKRLAVLIIGLALLAIPVASANAASMRTVSTVYYCTASKCADTQAALEPPSGPVFNPKPAPTITAHPVSLTYDPTGGVLTYSEGTPDDTYPFLGAGACDDGTADDADDPCTDTDTDDLQIAAQWTNLGFFALLDGNETPGPFDDHVLKFGYEVDDDYGPEAEWSSSGQEIPGSGSSSRPGLTETGVRGSLAPTESVNGGTVTFTWSSPYLKDLNLTEVNTKAGVEGEFENYLGELGIGPLYFAGYNPVRPPPPPPKIPTGDLLAPKYEKVKPAWRTPTGDGSLFFGGRIGRSVDRHGSFGHLHWTTYNQTEADATGIAWTRFSPGKFDLKAYVIEGTAKLHFYDLVDGAFTKLTWIEHYGRNPQHVAKRFRGKTRTYHSTYLAPSAS